MPEEKTQYGLRHKVSGRVLKQTISSNDGHDFCGDVSYTLYDSNSGDMWLLEDPEQVEWVRYNTTEWYNAGKNTPQHYFKADELEVVSVQTIVEAKPIKVKIPTAEEIYTRQYKNKPAELNFHRSRYEENNKEAWTKPIYGHHELMAYQHERNREIKKDNK